MLTGVYGRIVMQCILRASYVEMLYHAELWSFFFFLPIYADCIGVSGAATKWVLRTVLYMDIICHKHHYVVSIQGNILNCNIITLKSLTLIFLFHFLMAVAHALSSVL